MSSIPTTAAGLGHGAAPARRSTRYSNGLLGVIFFLCSEVALFGGLIFAYLYLRRSLGVWPPLGIHKLELALPAINTVILVTSGIWCHYADTAAARGNRRRVILMLILTICFGLAFLAGQAWEYRHLATSISHDIFGATFFTLTGLHGIHVSLGVVALATLLLMGLRGRWTPEHHFPVTGVTLYWHFVDVVWVVLFVIFYLV